MIGVALQLIRIFRAAKKPLRCASLALATAGLLSLHACAQSPTFYAIGAAGAMPEVVPPNAEAPPQHILYAVDSATLRVLGSVEVDGAQSGMLTANRNAVVLGGFDSPAWRVSAPDLKVVSSFTPGPSPGVSCLDHTFVHPVTGLAYFSCDIGSGKEGVAVMDTAKKSVVLNLYAKGLGSLFSSSHFLFDRKTGWLFLDGIDLVALDAQNKIVDQVSGRELGQKATPTIGDISGLRAAAILPNGRLVLRGNDDGGRSVLLLYDPMKRSVSRTWVETEKYTATEKHPTPGTAATWQSSLPLSHGPVASRDGSRLFAISDAPSRYHDNVPIRGVLLDAETLTVLRRWDLPEPPCSIRGQTEEQCFFQAPDGRGMWYVSQSGKVYRLDDHTGELLEEVKLPFHLISLIREP